MIPGRDDRVDEELVRVNIDIVTNIDISILMCARRHFFLISWMGNSLQIMMLIIDCTF